MTILVNHSCVQDLPKNTRTGPVVLALTCSPKEDSSPLDAPDGSDEPTGCGIHAWSRHKKTMARFTAMEKLNHTSMKGTLRVVRN